MFGPEVTPREDEEILRQLRDGGAPEEEVAKLGLGRAKPDSAVYEIWPENFDALRAFLFAAGSQWRVIAGAGGVVYQGIEYSEVARALELYPPERTTKEEAWWGVRVIEAEATRLKNEKVEQEIERRRKSGP